MKRCIVILLALMLLAACGAKEQVPAMEPKDQSSSISKPAPAPPSTKPEEIDVSVEDVIDTIMDNYYLFDYPEINHNGFIPDDLTVGRLARWHTTNSGDKETMGTLLEKLQNGEKLADNLQTKDIWRALIYDSDGNVCGGVDVSTVDHTVIASSLDGEATFRWDFRWPELLEAAIAEGKIDSGTARMKTCDFLGFATGAMLYDDSREYFIPTNREALHSVGFEVGTLYPLPELTEMLQNNIDELFDYSPMNLGAAP